MGWNTFVGHSDQIAHFRQIVANGRLAHTYLFLGLPGIGKRTFARELANCLLCERRVEHELASCGTCSGCKQVQAATHPDLFQVGCPEGKREMPLELFLGAPERRGREGLCYELSRTPMAGRGKIAIIDDANLLNDESANALLKTLEEPPPHSLIILVGTNIDGILPTIRSRCQIVRFEPLTPPQVQELLLRNEMTDDPQLAAEVAALCEGSLTAAAQILDPVLRSLREDLFNGLAATPYNSVALTGKILDAINEAGDTSAQRQQAAWLVKFGVEFYRTVLWHLAGGPQEPFATAIPAAVKFASRLPADDATVERMGILLERVIETEDHLAQNATVAVCLETLFDEIGRLQRGDAQQAAR